MPSPNGAIGRLVEQLAGEALNGHLRNVRSYSQLRRLIADGVLTDREVNEAYSEYARENASAYRKAAADLTLRYQQDLSELGARYSDDFYQSILDGHRTGSRPAPAGPLRRDGDEVVERIPIELHGRVGRELVSRFTIENTDSTPTTVEFEFEPCRAPHGETFHAPITVQPTRVELEPGGSAPVLLRLALMPSVFVPGLIYHQTVRPVGGAPVALDITFWVEDEDEPPTGAPDGEPVARVGSATAGPLPEATEPVPAPDLGAPPVRTDQPPEQVEVRRAAAVAAAGGAASVGAVGMVGTPRRRAPVTTSVRATRPRARSAPPARTGAVTPQAPGAGEVAGDASPANTSPRRAAANKAPAEGATARKAPATGAPAKKARAEKARARKQPPAPPASAGAAPTRRSPAKKAAVKKAAVKKAAVKKSAAEGASSAVGGGGSS